MRRTIAEAMRLESAALSVALKALTLPLTVPLVRRNRHLMWRLFETCFGSQRPHVYPEIALGQLVERETEIRVVELPGETFNVTEFELVAIAAIARAMAPRLIVEFGTADGRTTLNLARNSPPDCRVVTINLPLDEDSGHAQETAVGSRFLGTAESTRIVQVWGNTRSVDLSLYERRCQLVFIDADHSEEGVVADSLTALKLLDRDAVILWHDALRYGVQHGLPRLARERDLPIHLISGTNLACLYFADGKPAPPHRLRSRASSQLSDVLESASV
jgi:predicted O-methyltransferase YrrM